MLSQTISAFEPRLREVRASFSSYDPSKSVMHMYITAVLVIDELGETFSFPIALKTNGGSSGTNGV